MNLQQFNTLNRNRKLRKLLIDGSCIGERMTDDMQVLLFQLHCFYVEVFMNSEGDEVLYTRSFDNTEELQPYLEQVNVPDLF